MGSMLEIDRRRVLLGTTSAVGALILESSTLSPAAAQQPKRGGVYRAGLATGSNNDTLDPAYFSTTFSAALGFGILRNCLMRINPSGTLEPDLAESVEPSGDRRKWTFTLKRGLEFHGGRTVKASDVVASLNYHRGDQSRSVSKSLLENVEDIRADGEGTVAIVLKEPDPDFPYVLIIQTFVIVPGDPQGGIDWQSGAGTGPFMLKQFTPGVKASATRNPNYHQPGLPNFDAVELVSIPDSNARVSALLSGEIDYAERCDPNMFDRLSKLPNVSAIEVKGGGAHFTAPMICTAAPFNDNNIRLAMKYAIDREMLVDRVLNGHALVGNDSPVPPTQKYYFDPEPRHVFDPDRARFYLKKANVDKLSVKLSAADAAFAGAVDAAVLMQSAAAKCGIEITPVREPNDGYFSNVTRVKPWCLSYWNGRPTVNMLFTQLYGANSVRNESFWSNERFEFLVKAARSETDESKRSDIYREVQQLIHDDCGNIVLMFNSFLSAISNKIQHPDKLVSYLDQDGYRMYERWWFS